MTSIDGTLDIRRVGSNDFLTLNSVDYFLDCLKAKDNPKGRVNVPRYFRYNGGSIPRIAWPIVGCPFGTRADPAFKLHDWLYALDEAGSGVHTRLQADDAMFEIMIYCGVNELKAFGVYAAVRAFGWAFWGDKTPDVQDNEYDEYFLDL